MVDAYRRAGMVDRPATFSLFVRALPARRNYLVAAGLDDVLTWLEQLRFGPDELAAVERLDLYEPAFLDWLSQLRFTGSVRAVPEGSIVFAGEPILEIDAPIGEGQLAETFLLNQITLQTMLATKAARCRHAAAGRAVVDFSLRRTHGTDAGMKMARVARLVGLEGTSNVAGADHYGLPASGTMAHAFVQAHEDETEAFRSFASVFGDQTVLLVDTYDTARGVERAIVVAHEMQERGGAIRAIRLDSGDVAALARTARRRLDEEGLGEVRIFVSGGLDEYAIEGLVRAGAPVDGFGVGTALGASTDEPSLESVYKLVASDGRPVRKTSTGKRTWPAAKQVWRPADWSGDVLGIAGEPPPGPTHEALLEDVFVDGDRVGAGRRSLAEAHEHFVRQWAALPEPFRDLDRRRTYPVAPSGGLRTLDADLDHGRHDR